MVMALLSLTSAAPPAQVEWTRRTQMAGSDRDLLQFDPARQRLAVFDAFDLADAWDWNGVQWSRRTSAHVPPAVGPDQGSFARVQLAADPVRGRIVAAVPVPASGTVTLWEWDGTSWLPRVPAAWTNTLCYPALLQHDPARQRTVRLGGAAWDVAEWDGVQWLPRTTTTSPPGAPSPVADSQTHHLVYLTSERALFLLSPQTRVAWRYGPAFPADFTSFGAACAAGAQLPPRLQASGASAPWSGAPFPVEVQDIGAAGQVLMLVGASRTSWFGAFPLPFDLTPSGMPGCMLRVRADWIGVANLMGTCAQWSVSIPGDPALLGSAFYLQGLLADPAANPGGLLFTEGGTATIGAK